MVDDSVMALLFSSMAEVRPSNAIWPTPSKYMSTVSSIGGTMTAPPKLPMVFRARDVSVTLKDGNSARHSSTGRPDTLVQNT